MSDEEKAPKRPCKQDDRQHPGRDTPTSSDWEWTVPPVTNDPLPILRDISLEPQPLSLGVVMEDLDNQEPVYLSSLDRTNLPEPDSPKPLFESDESISLDVHPGSSSSVAVVSTGKSEDIFIQRSQVAIPFDVLTTTNPEELCPGGERDILQGNESPLVPPLVDFDEEIYLDASDDQSFPIIPFDVDYESFYDAHEYFTMEDDPHQDLYHTPTPEDSFCEVPNPEDGESSFYCTAEEDQPTADPPLYPGATLTVSETSIAFLSLMLNNDISGELIGRILSFIQLILPAGNKFFSTLHSLLSYFKDIKTPLNFIYYCSSCMRGLTDKSSTCPRCGPKGKVDYYLHLPVIPQIRALYANPAFVEALSYRFNRTKINPDNLEDIYDGELYKSASHILSQPFNTSLFWNTDGISPYNSSNFQLWPFYYSFNELPPHLREKPEYMVLAGVAFGKEKPACNIFLKPICEEMEVLREGIDVEVANQENPVNVKVIVLCGTCDAPAKSCFFRMTNFNGFFGCPRCEANGFYDDAGKVFTYPFQDIVTNRTMEGYCENLRVLKESGVNKPVCGVKGPTYLFKMVWTFFLTSTAVDVMHNVYLGVCRQLFYLWFSSTFLKHVFGDHAEKKSLIEKLSQILCNMQAPHYMSRPPRSLLNVKYFKASEFRTWLFSTALPTLQKFMKEPYFEHFKKLVCAIGLLNQSSVSLQDVEFAKILLKSFIHDFQQLYGIRNMSFNVHCLIHLPDVTLSHGPLWVSSCFGYEGLNGRLTRLVHGTRHAGLQIHAHLGLLRNLSPLTASLKNESVKNFCKSMILKGQQFKVSAKLGKGVLILGNIVREHILPPMYFDLICSKFDVCTNFAYFFRLKQNGYFYVAEDYGKGSRDSSAVKYTLNENVLYGCVKVFVVVKSCTCEQINCDHPSVHCALINRFDCSVPFYTTTPVSVPIISILSVEVTNLIDIVPLENLVSVCFKMCVDSSTYLSVPLNPYELE